MTSNEQQMIDAATRAVRAYCQTAPKESPLTQILTTQHKGIAKAALKASRPYLQPQWKPIETAPRDGDEVLICGGYVTNDYGKALPITKPTIQGFCVNDETWGLDDRQYYPTHWMPLPKAPEPKESEEV